MKIFGHERKRGKDGRIGVVQRVHMYVGNIDRKVSGGKRSHIVRCSPPWSIKGGRATCKRVAHFESLGVYRFCLGFTIVKCLSRVSIFSSFLLPLLLHLGGGAKLWSATAMAARSG